MAVGLRTDERQFLIYDPNTVDHVFKAVEAAAVFMFGAWLQRKAALYPTQISDNMGTIGTILSKAGKKRMEIQAGLAANDVPDELVRAQRMWNIVQQWNRQPGSVPESEVVEVLDQFAGALAYLDQRNQSTGTNHPKWNSGLVSGQICESCGR